MEKTLLERVLELRAPGESAPPCLGAMNFGRRTDEAESKRILARALELGIRHIDTANAYGDGTSERIVGDALTVAILGQPHQAVLLERPPFDPDGRRLRA